MSAVHAARLDRSAFQIASLEDDMGDREFWLAKSPLDEWRPWS
jgi:hypothetical protein